jgi:hypothetical protein
VINYELVPLVVLERYRSYQEPGEDCPVCGVDTGDSEHWEHCVIRIRLQEPARRK